MTVINTRRVVVTGMGVVTPIGNTVDDFWAAAKAGSCATGPITNFDTEDLYIKIAAEIKDFEPQQRITNKLLQLADRYSKFAGVAAAEAVKQSGMPVPFTDPYRSAAIIGSGAGGLNTIETAYRDLFILNKRATHPFTLLRFIGSSAAAHVGIDYGIKGPTFGTVSACATATHAIGIVYQYIRYGLVDVGIGGAAEAALNYGSMKSWQALRVLSDKGCFPFSKERNGTVLGEGAGTLVLEELEHAKARGANILAEICGYGMTSDAKDMVKPDLEGPKVAMQMALDDAKLSPSDIDYLNAHGTGTTDNDVNETRAIRAVFGTAAGNLAVSSTKSMTGHLLGAGGAVEAVACIKAMQDGILPPTINLRTPDPECDLDYVPNVARAKKVGYTMSNSFAFGGLNAVLVFGPPPV